MTTGAEETVQPAAAPPAEVDPFKRLAGVLFAPVRTFAEIARKPDMAVPLVLILVIGYASTFAILPRVDWDSMMDFQYQAAKARNPNMTQDQFQQGAKFISAFTKGVFYVMPVLLVAWYAIVAGILLLGVRMFGGEGNFNQAFSVVLYSWIPYVLLSIIFTIVVVVKGTWNPIFANALVPSNLAFLTDMKAHPVLYAALAMLDLSTVWVLALLTIGFAAVSKMSKGKTAAIVIPAWLILSVIRLGFAAMGAAKMKG